MSEVEKTLNMFAALEALENLALTVECEPNDSPNVMEAVKAAYEALEKAGFYEKCSCTTKIQCELCFIAEFRRK
jgi:hypothetical protein